MRVLLVHPDDFPLTGPWSSQHWDLVLDLGKSSQFSADRWGKHFRCPVVRAESFRQGIDDAYRVRAIFAIPRGRLLDEEGIDWWDLVSLLVAPEAFELLAMQRVARELTAEHEWWSTRSGGPVHLLESVLGRPIQTFGKGVLAHSAARVLHYAGLLRRFPPAQFKEIFLDKYDPAYAWRSRIAGEPKTCTEAVVLVPSAYGNVSRMASAYARLLPSQAFLMVATRQSAKKFSAPPNFEIRNLAAYATSDSSAAEADSLLNLWLGLKKQLESVEELHALDRAGVFHSFVPWIRSGIAVRDAWREVLEREPVLGVLCGDDSNLYTRLPLLLAARRGIPNASFHHGALDGRYILKELPSDLYLAKNEMERDYLMRVCCLPAEKVVIAAPPPAETDAQQHQKQAGDVIFFSEPYEVVGMRAKEVYAEILPELFRLARANQRGLVIKLHPFESRSQRRRIVADVLGPEAVKAVNVVDGPLTQELLAQAWFGVTVESSTVIDCLQSGVCCFLCGWLGLSPFGYTQQYMRFGIGEVLESPQQIARIPEQVERFSRSSRTSMPLSPTPEANQLQEWLTSRARPAVRSAS